MKHFLLPLLFLCISLLSCDKQCTPCDAQVSHTIDSLKTIYEELKSPQVETVKAAKVLATPTVYTDGLTVSKPSTTERITFTKGDKTGYFDTKTDRYTVYCGKRNTMCSVDGSLYIVRVSKNSGEEYNQYLQ